MARPEAVRCNDAKHIRMLSLTVNEILFAKDGTRQKEITSIAQGAKGVDGWVVGAGTCYNRLGI